MTQSKKNLIAKIIRTIVVLALALLCAFPLYYIIVSSFKDPIDMTKNPFSLPNPWVGGNYIEAFADGTIIRAFVNTVIVTVAAVFLQVFFGSMAAYGIIQKKSRFTRSEEPSCRERVSSPV